MRRGLWTFDGPELAEEVREILAADGHDVENSGYYRERANRLAKLADTGIDVDTEIALRHLAAEFDNIANLIEMKNGERPWPLQEMLAT